MGKLSRLSAMLSVLVLRESSYLRSSVGMLLGYHLLWSWTANVVGTEEQKTKAQENIIRNNFFIGGKVVS